MTQLPRLPVEGMDFDVSFLSFLLQEGTGHCVGLTWQSAGRRQSHQLEEQEADLCRGTAVRGSLKPRLRWKVLSPCEE